MMQPIRPAGAPDPASRAVSGKPRPAEGSAFAEQLQKDLKDPEAPVAADPKLAQIQHFVAQALSTEAWEACLLETYDMLSADEGLYEVQTSQGPYQVIRSRMGTLSLYSAT